MADEDTWEEGVTFEDAPEFEQEEPQFEDAQAAEPFEETQSFAAEGEEWDEEWDDEWDGYEEGDLEVEAVQGLPPLAIGGLVTMLLGAASFIIGAIIFLMGFPDDWYATNGQYDESRRLIERVWIVLGSGLVALLFGNSLFQFGQTHRGAGYIHVEDE